MAASADSVYCHIIVVVQVVLIGGDQDRHVENAILLRPDEFLALDEQDPPEPGVRLVIVTSGTGASTGFGLAERVIGDLFNMEVGEMA